MADNFTLEGFTEGSFRRYCTSYLSRPIIP